MSASNRSQRKRSEKRRKHDDVERRYKQHMLEHRRAMEITDVSVVDTAQRVGGEVDAEERSRKRKFILGLLLTPVTLLVLVVFFDLLFEATVKGAFWRSEGFWFLLFGCLCWLCMGWMHRQPGVMYVFAHEMTHAIAARLSGGKIHRMLVEREGGFVETDKTSTLITLSPYMVPFYTVVVVALYGLLSIFVDMHRVISIPVFGWSVILKWSWIMYFLVGLTLSFHLTFTMRVLQTEQSDLLHNGEFFSMMLIFLANLAVLITLFVVASPTVSWGHVWQALYEMFRGGWQSMTGRFG